MKKNYLNDETSNTFIEFLTEKFKNNEIDFKQLVDKSKSTHELYKLLEDNKLFEELIQSDELKHEELEYFLNVIDNSHYILELLCRNKLLLKHIIDNDLFQKLIDAHKSVDTTSDSYLYMLLKNEELFQELIKNNKLNEEDTRYLLNKIDKSYEIANLFTNDPLLKFILNEFILNAEDVDRFNDLIEKEHWYRSINKEIRFVCIDNVFDSIKFYTTHKFDYRKREWHERDEDEIDREVLELNELNRYLDIFKITKEQRLKIFEILKDNEIARNSLIQIVENHVENNYDFESLMMYLKKKEKRNLINI